MPENATQADPDPIEGREIAILNAMLAALHPKATAGDEAAIDRVLKILELKRQYRRDRRIAEIR